MGGYTLTVIDTSGIQPFIFGTNQLRQNAGASYLVECATRHWVKESLEHIGLKHNINNFDNLSSPLFRNRHIEQNTDRLDAEVVYAGGGNTVLIFKDHDNAHKFTRTLSRKVLLSAPGLNLVFAHISFDWSKDALGGIGGIVDRTIQAVAQRKGELATGLHMLGMSVSAPCVFTGKPAVGADADNRLVSAEVCAKLAAEEEAAERLTQLFGGGWAFPKEFDDLGGTKGESSYIAVIHTDGNDMGKRIEEIKKHYPHAGDGNRGFITAMRNFSQSIQDAAYKALDQTLDYLTTAIDKETNLIADQVKVKGHVLPFRPIVFGGDDVTFVCDGRLGLSLAVFYLEMLSAQMLTDNQKMFCRAGVSVVKSHYPFARAYDLAEELCKSAKQHIKTTGGALTAMDWHFAVTGAVQPLSEIRAREYQTDCGRLLMRPVGITGGNGDWRSWDTFLHIVTSFQSSKTWAHRRNRVKALREALRFGPDAVKNFLVSYEIPGARLPGYFGTQAPPGWSEEIEFTGWQPDGTTNVCGYFDAIEASDFYFGLAGGKTK